MPLLITGASGQLGGYLLRELARQGVPAVAWSGTSRGERFGFPLRPVNLADVDAVTRAFVESRATAIMHAGAVTRLADAVRDPERARAVNAGGTATLARLAAGAGVRLILVSTDLVFDGHKGSYREEDPPAPLSVYGRSKHEAEQEALAHAGHLVVRVSLLFGPTVTGRPSFFDEQVQALQQARPIRLFADEWRTPLSYSRAAQALLALVSSDETGILHLGGPERLSRLEMGERVADFLRCDRSSIIAAMRDSVPGPEPRPRDTSLDSSRWRKRFPSQPWPGFEESLREMGNGPGR